MADDLECMNENGTTTTDCTEQHPKDKIALDSQLIVDCPPVIVLSTNGCKSIGTLELNVRTVVTYRLWSETGDV